MTSYGSEFTTVRMNWPTGFVASKGFSRGCVRGVFASNANCLTLQVENLSTGEAANDRTSMFGRLRVPAPYITSVKVATCGLAHKTNVVGWEEIG